MKKYIAFVLFFGSFGVAFAQVRGFNGDITWMFYDRPGSSLGLCEVLHFNSGDPRYKKCSFTNTLAECQIATCDAQVGSLPAIQPVLLPPRNINGGSSLPVSSPVPSPEKEAYYKKLQSMSRGGGVRMTDIPRVSKPASRPVFIPSKPFTVRTAQVTLFGVVFRSCPADSSRTDLKNEYIVVRIYDGQPPYSITTPGFVSQSMKVEVIERLEGNVSYWGVRVAAPRYENTEIPLSVRDAVGQIVRLTARTSACPS